MICDGINVSNIYATANRTIGVLRRNLYAYPQEIKEAASKGLVRPVLEYSGSVWDPSGVGLQNELEKFQNWAARFVTGNYNFETGSMTGILEHLKWESFKKRRRDSRLILLYKGVMGKASKPTGDLIIPWHVRSPLLTLIFISVVFPPDHYELECTPRLSYLLCWRCRGWCC